MTPFIIGNVLLGLYIPSDLAYFIVIIIRGGFEGYLLALAIDIIVTVFEKIKKNKIKALPFLFAFFSLRPYTCLTEADSVSPYGTITYS